MFSVSIFRSIFCIIAGLFVLQSTTTQAQWTPCNGPLGGRVRSMTQSGTTLFASLYRHGVYRSTDHGAHWIPSGLTTQDVNFLTTIGSQVYAGGDSGIYRSSTNGASWELLLMNKSNEEFQALISRGTTIYACSGGGGVYRSTDNGVTWKVINTGIPTLDVTSLAMVDTVLLAGTNRKGVYRSLDNGETWKPVFLNVPNPNNFNFERFIVASIDSIFFCGCGGQGMRRSLDYGKTWEACDTGRIITHVSSLQIINSALYTLSGTSVDRSSTYGQQWESFPTGGLSPVITSLAMIGNDIYLGAIDGIYKSTDSGRQYKQVNTGINLLPVIKLASKGRVVYAGTEPCGLHKSEDGGNSWTQLGFQSQGIEAICVQDSILLVSTQKGIYRSTDDGVSWSTTFTPKYFVSRMMTVDTVVFACATNTMPSSGMYHPIYRSLDHGLHWEEVPLEVEAISFRAFTAIGNTLVVAGSRIFRSTDLGNSWQEVVDTTMNGKRIQDITAIGTMLVAATSADGVFRSDDMGTSWQSANEGLKSPYSYPLCSDTKVLYTRNSVGGVSKSVDKGGRWTAAEAGLTTTSVNAFCFAGSSLYLGSDMGTWKLENASSVMEDNFQSLKNQLVQCYPNPTSSEITIDCTSLPFNSTDPIHYSITYLTGQKLMEFDRAESRCTFSTEKLGNGVYCLIAEQGLTRSHTFITVIH